MQQKPFKVIPYQDRHRKAFYDLNVEWLTTFFVVEPIDEMVLSDPQTHILDHGGEIFMAEFNGKAVGAVAMKKQGDGIFELTKLAVTPRVQKGGMGRALSVSVIEAFKKRNGEKLYLETNRRLTSAIALYIDLGFVEMENPEPTLYDRADYYAEWHGQ